MSKEIEEQLQQLRELNNIGFLDDETLDKAEKMWESVNSKKDNGFRGITVKFINESNYKNPTYETDGSAGFDFRANITESLVIPGKRNDNNIVIVPTGLFFELPKNIELQVRPRSGLAAKHGITVLNSPGTVDSDYRGEVKIILINHKNEDFTINPGDRIAQGVLSNVINKTNGELIEVVSLGDTDRGNGGFGSTGVK